MTPLSSISIKALFDSRILKIVAAASISSAIFLIAYKQWLDNQTFSSQKISKMTKINNDLLEKLKSTNDTLVNLRQEILDLRKQVAVVSSLHSNIDDDKSSSKAYRRTVSWKSDKSIAPSLRSDTKTEEKDEMTVCTEDVLSSVYTDSDIFESAANVGGISGSLPFINLNIITYNPLPHSSIPFHVAKVCIQVDELHYKSDEAVLETFDCLVEVLKTENFVDLIWRICRACLYLSTLSKILKDYSKQKYYTQIGLKYANQGLKLLESEIFSPNDQDYYESKITTIAQMYKWGGSIIGSSAGVVSSLKEKVTSGIKSKNLFLKAMETDPDDYSTVYNIARWHFEVYSLSSFLKRTANYISPEPYNSTLSDVLKFINIYIEKYPNKFPFIELPADFCLLAAKCYKNDGKIDEAKKWLQKGFDGLDYEYVKRSNVENDTFLELEEFKKKI